MTNKFDNSNIDLYKRYISSTIKKTSSAEINGHNSCVSRVSFFFSKRNHYIHLSWEFFLPQNSNRKTQKSTKEHKRAQKSNIKSGQYIGHESLDTALSKISFTPPSQALEECSMQMSSMGEQ